LSAANANQPSKCSEAVILNYQLFGYILSKFQEGDKLLPVDEKGNIITSDADYVDTWKGMEECVKLGLAKSIGVSNFNSRQIQRILDIATIKPVANQVR
jgi:diketogulonate reductase-like aldo/keto reductase